ncbi:hypothetical protein M0R72_12700 [Candidatus Pacearchaeota archaeon]|jgi:hypothetical protein|nr:hypothetical protein [Candidatus Pacearchaeota archaeon]
MTPHIPTVDLQALAAEARQEEADTKLNEKAAIMLGLHKAWVQEYRHAVNGPHGGWGWFDATGELLWFMDGAFNPCDSYDDVHLLLKECVRRGPWDRFELELAEVLGYAPGIPTVNAALLASPRDLCLACVKTLERNEA